MIQRTSTTCIDTNCLRLVAKIPKSLQKGIHNNNGARPSSVRENEFHWGQLLASKETFWTKKNYLINGITSFHA